MGTVRVDGFRFNLNKALEVKAEAAADHGASMSVMDIAEAAKAVDNGDKYLNAKELRRGMRNLIGRAYGE